MGDFRILSFAEATVNRLWSFFFGRGIVEPVDDFRAPIHRRIRSCCKAWRRISRDSGYDLKLTDEDHRQSRTYQLSATPNESNKEDKIDYSHALARPLEAAVLLDAITSVTGVPEKFELHHIVGGGDAPLGTRAICKRLRISARRSSWMISAVRREGLCHREPTAEACSKALHMMSGPAYNAKVTSEGGRLSGLLKKGASDEEILDEFYVAALMRPATNEEKSELLRVPCRAFVTPRRDSGRTCMGDPSIREEFAYNH